MLLRHCCWCGPGFIRTTVGPQFNWHRASRGCLDNCGWCCCIKCLGHMATDVGHGVLCVSVCVSVCLSVCWSYRCTVQKQLNRSRCRLGAFGSWFLWVKGTVIYFIGVKIGRIHSQPRRVYTSRPQRFGLLQNYFGPTCYFVL